MYVVDRLDVVVCAQASTCARDSISVMGLEGLGPIRAESDVASCA